MLAQVPENVVLGGTLTLGWRYPGAIYSIFKVTQQDGTVWRHASYPEHLSYELAELPFAAVRLPEKTAFPSTDVK